MALEFNGSSSSVALGNIDVPTSTLQFTMSCWVRPATVTSNTDPRYISKANGTAESAHWWMLGATSNGARLRARVKFAGTTTTFIEPGSSMVANQWQHVMWTWFGGVGATLNYSLYRNGVLLQRGNANQAAISIDNTVPARIGANGNNVNWFNGRICDVRIYTKYMTNQAANDLWVLRGNDSLLDGLLWWWPLQELAPNLTATVAVVDRIRKQNGSPSSSPIYRAEPFFAQMKHALEQ